LSGTIAGNAVNGAYDEKNGKIKFTYAIAPKDFETEVTLTLADGSSQTTSVKAYLNWILSNEANPAYDVASKILTYCEAAKTYFAGGTATATDALTADLTAYKATVSGEQAGIVLQGATLELEEKTNIFIYFKSQDMTGIECKVNGETVTATEWKEGYYVIVIDDISATDLDTMYEVSIGGITVNYGAYSYVETACANANVALANVVKALYAYGVAAEAYFNANQNN
jgi:hypothetical protein